MSATLAIALLIPWIFWGVLMGLLSAAGRSWINMVPIPAGITVVLLIGAGLSSGQEAFWASLILHAFLLILFLASYISFMLRERKKKQPDQRP